ncbi:hypothetical protein F2Q69_00052868 [Brassica cretica]|uniref:Uncharacterized protein n=1 Tax=Brassica cretica TaxID=69181 RepID=A0A8S9MTH2_BRACR|nr:hypothetical protein F2Q69_00052868 [Brassica cretica]
MKRGFLGLSKKKPSDSCTIRKSTREESIDTLQATAIDSVNQKSIDSLLDDVMGKRDEQHGFGEPSKVEEFDTSDPTSASIDSSIPDSIDISTS